MSDALNGITRKPAFWIAYALLALVSRVVAARSFRSRMPLVNLDIKMSRARGDRERAQRLAQKLKLAPAEARARPRASTTTARTQNYVELEGGGKRRVRAS